MAEAVRIKDKGEGEVEVEEISRPTDKPLRIVRLKDKREKPVEKEACVKRGLKKIKVISVPKGKVVPAKEIIKKTKEQFGKKGYQILIPDSKYRTITKEAMKKLVRKDRSRPVTIQSSVSRLR